jgi:small conductance mechanosensitive channel
MITLTADWPLYARVGVAFAVALIAFPAAGLAASAVRKAARKGSRLEAIDPTVATFGAELVRVLFLICALVLVLSLAGVQSTSLAAVLGAATLAIGLAMQATLANVAAGVLIFVFAPYRVGEFVEIAGRQGQVKLLSLFTTELEAPTGIAHVLANAQVMAQPITNFTRNPARRIDIDVTLNWFTDTDQAMKLALAAVERDARLHPDRPPIAIIKGTSDKGPQLSLRLWTMTNDHDAFHATAAAKVHAALSAAGIRGADAGAVP